MSAPIESERHDTPLERANRLLAEAREAARDQVLVLERAMDATAALSSQIGGGGDIYPPGVRELCRRMAEETDLRARSLSALSARLLEQNRPPR